MDEEATKTRDLRFVPVVNHVLAWFGREPLGKRDRKFLAGSDSCTGLMCLTITVGIGITILIYIGVTGLVPLAPLSNATK